MISVLNFLGLPERMFFVPQKMADSPVTLPLENEHPPLFEWWAPRPLFEWWAHDDSFLEHDHDIYS